MHSRKDFGDEIFHHMWKHAVWIDPKYDTDTDYWLALFHEEREAAMNRFTDQNPPHR
jgi:hypothetical protein